MIKSPFNNHTLYKYWLTSLIFIVLSNILSAQVMVDNPRIGSFMTLSYKMAISKAGYPESSLGAGFPTTGVKNCSLPCSILYQFIINRFGITERLAKPRTIAESFSGKILTVRKSLLNTLIQSPSAFLFPEKQRQPFFGIPKPPTPMLKKKSKTNNLIINFNQLQSI